MSLHLEFFYAHLWHIAGTRLPELTASSVRILYALNCVHKMKLKIEFFLVLVHVTLLGDRVFADDQIKMKPWCPNKKGEI